MLVLATLILSMIALITLVGCIEKRMIWPYGDLQPNPLVQDALGYEKAAFAAAQEAGFVFLGRAPDLKGDKYKVSYAFLVSPDRSTLAIVGIGTIFGMPLNGTWLNSIGRDGRCYYSTDNQSCIEFDLTKTRISQLVKTNSFQKLWEKHTQWLTRLTAVLEPFQPGQEVQQLRAFRQTLYQSMARQNIIHFTDANQTHWRYTVQGSAKFTFLNYCVGLMRALTLGRFPRNA